MLRRLVREQDDEAAVRPCAVVLRPRLTRALRQEREHAILQAQEEMAQREGSHGGASRRAADGCCRPDERVCPDAAGAGAHCRSHHPHERHCRLGPRCTSAPPVIATATAAALSRRGTRSAGKVYYTCAATQMRAHSTLPYGANLSRALAGGLFEHERQLQRQLERAHVL